MAVSTVKLPPIPHLPEETISSLKHAIAGLHRHRNAFEIAREAFEKLSEPLNLSVYFNYLVVKEGADLWLSSYEGIPDIAAGDIQHLKFGQAVCGTVARSGAAMNVSDVQCSTDEKTDLVRSFGVRAYCCNPVIVDGRIVGTLSFGSRVRSRFSEEEAGLMRLAADEIGLGLKEMLPLIAGIPVPGRE